MEDHQVLSSQPSSLKTLYFSIMMLGSLRSIFRKIKFKKSGTKGRRSTYVARDNLDVQHKGGDGKWTMKPSYCDMKHARTYDNKCTMRVKVLMTKEEARLLLTKCDDRGALNFKDVATEITQIPTDRVAIVSHDSPNGKIMLDSIPEEI
ncbi:hypothetical protein CTI12_AA426510 [Artemisia annua]|uniref:DUF7890 domain-containing protein n=1 Tax=Artemisia annua TaxID=35608 RepID=A0A2U1M2U2_ARTAN|nr:hypothetical protein CTI12_AA426510 [Artemisia annua]